MRKEREEQRPKDRAPGHVNKQRGATRETELWLRERDGLGQLCPEVESWGLG